MKVKLVLIAALCASVLTGQPAPVASPSWSVSGTVTTLQGAPIEGATVTLQASAIGATSPNPSSVITSADGSFVVPEVAVGDYRVCVPTSPGYLNPCVWGGFPSSVSVTADAAPDPVHVGLNAGVELALHVDDPSQSMKGNTQDNPGTAVMPVVSAAMTPIVPLTLAGVTDTGYDYVATVPAEVPLSVAVTSTQVDFQEADKAKAEFARGGVGRLGKKLTIPRGRARTQLRLRAVKR